MNVDMAEEARRFHDCIDAYSPRIFSTKQLIAKRAERLMSKRLKRIAREYAIYTDGRIAFLISKDDTDLIPEKAGKDTCPDSYEECVSALVDFLKPQTESVAVVIVGAGQFVDYGERPCLYMLASSKDLDAQSVVVQARYWKTIMTRFPDSVPFLVPQGRDKYPHPVQFVNDGTVVAIIMPWLSSQTPCDVVHIGLTSGKD